MLIGIEQKASFTPVNQYCSPVSVPCSSETGRMRDRWVCRGPVSLFVKWPRARPPSANRACPPLTEQQLQVAEA